MQIFNIFLDRTVIDVTVILSCFFITFARLLGKDFYWVIDDLDGLAKFAERWDGKKKIDSYEVDTNKLDKDGKHIHKEVKFLSFIPELGFPGCVLRFLRLHWGKEFKVIGTNEKGHEVWGYTQSPRKHHLLSMFIQALCLVLGYTFLHRIFGAPVAFGACLLYAVHPLCTQSVAWISGINYSLCLMFSLALFNISVYCPIPIVKVVLIPLVSFLSAIALYVGGLSWIILLVLGHWWEALLSAIVGLGILYWKGTETKKFRVAAFKEQNMGSTTFISIRKPIVMLKTLWYYMRMIFVPLQMGLYHVWGYFYEEPIERINWMFWRGFAVLLLSAYCMVWFGPIVRFGIIWFLTYWIIFSNLITAQQFVADRYATIPVFGICIILSSLFYGTPIFWVLFGLYAMRTFIHLFTFKNEIDFYHSNFQNFRKSEVALGNLGVAYINQQMPGAAVDTWMLATKINPHYDVPWYNLYSVFKGNGRLKEARDFLKNCLNAKVVHFDKKWREEFEQIDAAVKAQENPEGAQALYYKAAEHFNKGEFEKEIECLRKFVTLDTTGLLPEMIRQVKERLAVLEGEILSRNTSKKP